MTELQVVVADDHSIVRHGLVTLLKNELGCRVVGEADDGFEALELVRQHLPDVLIIDILMPGITGLEVARRVQQLAPHTRIIILSMYGEEAYVRDALQAGVSGFVLKASRSTEIIQAVRDALDGQRYLSPMLSEIIIERYLQHYPSSHDLYDLLTDRERDVLHLAANGYTAIEIAKQLTLAVRTVESYRTSLMRKLDLHNQTELVLYAIKRGIITVSA